MFRFIEVSFVAAFENFTVYAVLARVISATIGYMSVLNINCMSAKEQQNIFSETRSE